MSYSRRKVIRALEFYGFSVDREGSRHTIYANSAGKKIPVGRHRQVDPEIAMLISREIGVAWNEFRERIS